MSAKGLHVRKSKLRRLRKLSVARRKGADCPHVDPPSTKRRRSEELGDVEDRRGKKPKFEEQPPAEQEAAQAKEAKHERPAAASRRRPKAAPDAGVEILLTSNGSASSSTTALARFVPRTFTKAGRARGIPSSVGPPRPPPGPPPPAAAKPRVDVAQEIRRILAAESSLEVLGLQDHVGHPPTEVVASAFKRLALLLHPDKLHRLGVECRETGAEALDRVQQAKDELRQEAQKICAEVPAEPVPNDCRCLDGASGSRKFEISWRLPECQDPRRPVEKYEVWGPRYFSEAGDPFDWVLLATLPPLQSQFVIVEEAPTQQDVMWAADRIRRDTLPLTLHAVNGRGPSEALSFELPWAEEFPWLQGAASVLCKVCLRVVPFYGGRSRCMDCGMTAGVEEKIMVRCPECQGEAVWQQQPGGRTVLRCCCCSRFIAERQAAKPGVQWRAPSEPKPTWRQRPSGGRGGRSGGSAGRTTWTQRGSW